MSTRINLLPYRLAKRSQSKRQFTLAFIASVIVGGAVVMAAHGFYAGLILNQDSRNSFIQAENKLLDVKIEEIKRLKNDIDTLKARKEIIERLQTDRAAAVQVMGELVNVTPSGIYLKEFKQTGSNVVVKGLSQSNELVADMMLLIGQSKLIQDANLTEIKAIQVGERRLNEFSLTFNLKRTAAANPEEGNKKKGGNK